MRLSAVIGSVVGSSARLECSLNPDYMPKTRLDTDLPSWPAPRTGRVHTPRLIETGNSRTFRGTYESSPTSRSLMHACIPRVQGSPDSSIVARHRPKPCTNARARRPAISDVPKTMASSRSSSSPLIHPGSRHVATDCHEIDMSGSSLHPGLIRPNCHTPGRAIRAAFARITFTQRKT